MSKKIVIKEYTSGLFMRAHSEAVSLDVIDNLGTLPPEDFQWELSDNPAHSSRYLKSVKYNKYLSVDPALVHGQAGDGLAIFAWLVDDPNEITIAPVDYKLGQIPHNLKFLHTNYEGNSWTLFSSIAGRRLLSWGNDQNLDEHIPTCKFDILNLEYKKPFQVMGVRGLTSFDVADNGALVAVDINTGQPTIVDWLYDSAPLNAASSERYVDLRPNSTLYASSRDMTLSMVPQSVAPAMFTSLVAEISSFAALTNDGGVESWNSNGISILPPEIANMRDVISVTAGVHTYAALCSDGRVVAWGGAEDSARVPRKIADLRNIVSVVAGSYAFAALCSDGSVVAWGETDSGGDVPSDIAARRNIASVFTNDDSFFALCSDGSVVFWGDVEFVGEIPPRIANLRNIVSVVPGGASCAALCSDGSVVAWGNPDAGGTVPRPIAELRNIVSVITSTLAYAALCADGSVVAWGGTDAGGTVPQAIAELRNIVSVVAGMGNFAALCSDGSVVTWGGEPVPPEIASLRNIVSVVPSMGTGNDTGNTATAALCADGRVVAWGTADCGGTIPDKIATLRNIVSVIAGMNTFAALCADGSVWAWGLSLPISGATITSPTAAVYGLPHDTGFYTPFLCLGFDGKIRMLSGDENDETPVSGATQLVPYSSQIR